MNKRTISILLALTLAILMGLPEALALPQYLTDFQQVYTDGSCGTCHVSPAGGGTLNSYGMMFQNQPNHATDAVVALKAIGPAPGTSPLTTTVTTPTMKETPEVALTPTLTTTPNVTTTPTTALTPTAVLTPTAELTPTTPQVQGAMGGLQSLVNVFEDFYRLFMKFSLPQSLDKWFTNQTPEVPGNEWVGEMFAQAGAFEGIATNLQEGDMANATASYNAFASEYKNISQKVPEWQGYFDIATVDKLGDDLKANNTNASFQDIGTIGATCSKCHGDHQPQVWAKYYWRDFDTVNISGMPWHDGMFALAGAFDGIGVNAAEGKQNETNNSFNQFKALYTDTKQACNQCHDSPRFYYVSDDVFAKIDQMGQNITSGNLQNAQKIQNELGTQCYKCHVLHMPAQDMKDKMEK